jgi:hypothetical protein
VARYQPVLSVLIGLAGSLAIFAWVLGYYKQSATQIPKLETLAVVPAGINPAAR